MTSTPAWQHLAARSSSSLIVHPPLSPAPHPCVEVGHAADIEAGIVPDSQIGYSRSGHAFEACWARSWTPNCKAPMHFCQACVAMPASLIPTRSSQYSNKYIVPGSSMMCPVLSTPQSSATCVGRIGGRPQAGRTEHGRWGKRGTGMISPPR